MVETTAIFFPAFERADLWAGQVGLHDIDVGSRKWPG